MILVRALILKKGEIHQFGEHVGPFYSSAVNLLHIEGSGAVLWAETGLIFLKPLSCDLGIPADGEMKDAGRDGWPGHEGVIT